MSAIITRHWPSLFLADEIMYTDNYLAQTITLHGHSDHAYPDGIVDDHAWVLTTYSGAPVASGTGYPGLASSIDVLEDLRAERWDATAWAHEQHDPTALADWRVRTRQGERSYSYTLHRPNLPGTRRGGFPTEEAALAAAHARIAAIRGRED